VGGNSGALGRSIPPDEARVCRWHVRRCRCEHRDGSAVCVAPRDVPGRSGGGDGPRQFPFASGEIVAQPRAISAAAAQRGAWGCDRRGSHRTLPGQPRRSRGALPREWHDGCFDRSALLWIDTLGFEGNIIAGASRIMSRPRDRRPAVVCEFWPHGIERAGGKDRLSECFAGCTSIPDTRASGWSMGSTPTLGIPGLGALSGRLLGDGSNGEPLFTGGAGAAAATAGSTS
jgi:hypothetical protein